MFLRFLGLTIGLFAVNAYAIDCRLSGSSTCEYCAAPQQFACGDQRTGYVVNSVRPTTVTVTAMDTISGKVKSYSLPNTQQIALSGMRGELRNEKWIWDGITKQGGDIGKGFEVKMTGASFAKAPDMFKDVSATTAAAASSNKAEGGGVSAADIGLNCTFSGPVYVATNTGCAEKVCMGSAQCTDGGKPMNGAMRLACRALGNGTCPNATACAEDEKVTSVQATVDSATNRAGKAAR